MQAGYLEKAQKYTDKALMQLEKLKSEFASLKKYLILNNYIMCNCDKQTFCLCMHLNVYLPVSVLDCSPILSTFQVILLEHIIMCRLVTGHKATALQEVCICRCI